MSVQSVRCFGSAQAYNWKGRSLREFARAGEKGENVHIFNRGKRAIFARRTDLVLCSRCQHCCGLELGRGFRDVGQSHRCHTIRGRMRRANCSNFSFASDGADGGKKIVDKEDPEADLRKTNLVVRFLRLVVRSLKKLSPELLLRISVSFIKKRWKQVLFWTIVGSTLGLAYVCTIFSASASPKVVSYSELVDRLHSRTVVSALFEEGSRHIYFNVLPADESSSSAPDRKLGDSVGSLVGMSSKVTGSALESNAEEKMKKEMSSSESPVKGTSTKPSHESGASQKWNFSTRRIGNDESFLLGLMRDGGVTYSSAPQSVSATLKTVLITILTLWIPLSPLLWLLHRQLSQQSGSRLKRRLSSNLVKFGDVAGVDSAKDELMDIVSCIKGTSTFGSLGAKLPKGVLLVGPPGTGKTLLARAVAGEAGVPFFATSASEFVEMFVGRGAARVRELFAEARKCTPCIIFIDELDAVGGRRGRSFNDERDQTLNQLLTEMDGFDADTGVLVLAATNRPEALDPALCRPGRINRRVFVTEPDLKGRQQVLAIHMRGVPVKENPLLLQRVVASMTGGFVGADLANLVNEAALLAARKGHEAVALDDFKEAIARVKFGVDNRPRNFFKEAEQKLWSFLLTPQLQAYNSISSN